MLRFVFTISVLACGITQASEILINPGFESGSLAPWTNDTRYDTGVNWAVTTTNPHSGSSCAVDTGDIGLKQTFSPIPVSSVSAISFWVMHPNEALSALTAVDFFYVGGGDDEFYVSTPGSGWTFFNVLADLSDTGYLDGFEIFGYTGSGPDVTMADDFNITATIPEPPTFVLLLAGLIAIAIAARLRPSRI